MILDRFDDNDAFLQIAFDEKGLPALVKTAAHVNDMRSKHAEDFALVRTMEEGFRDYKYPVMDAGNAVASAVYFNEFGHNLPEGQQKTAAENISRALTGFGFVVPAELTKTAALELGYSHEIEGMTLEAIFGLERERSDVELIEDNFNDCSPRGKRRIAFQVKEAGLNIDGVDMDYIRETMGSDFELAVYARKMFVVGDEEKQLDELLEKAASMEVDSLVEALTEFDKTNELVHFYGEGIPNPLKSVLGTDLVKQAATNARIEVGDDSIPVAEFSERLEGIAGSLETAYGDELVSQLRDDPQIVYNSLPLPHKTAIANMMNGG